MSKKYYFFSLSFADNASRIVSAVVKSERRKLSEPVIRGAMRTLDMTDSAAMISAVCLGRMSDREYSEGYTQTFPYRLVAVALVAMIAGAAIVYALML